MIWTAILNATCSDMVWLVKDGGKCILFIESDIFSGITRRHKMGEIASLQ